MRSAALLVLLVLLVLLGAIAAGCTSVPTAPSKTTGTSTRTPLGCGVVGPNRVAGLVGSDARSTLQGSLASLRRRHTRQTCRSVAADDPRHLVTLTATYHPAPFPLPATSCAEGWVYAGSPAKYAPACQEGVGSADRSRTRLLVRWQPYLMHVTISRPDRNWGGDPEVALSMSREVAQELGVPEAAGDG